MLVQPIPTETRVLVLQGGGALGAYQGGAYASLQARGEEPDWIAGISIGAINAALIAGNPPERQVERLRSFWEKASSGFGGVWPGHLPEGARAILNEGAAWLVLLRGVPGFFTPRMPPAAAFPLGARGATSVYDTAPLRATLERLVDFQWLNLCGPRLSLGAVDVETGNFEYFDSRRTWITAEHVMASAALPPGLPYVEIEGRAFWDGGLVSNTPLQVVLEEPGDEPLRIYQVDLFNARGDRPGTLAEAAQREKDIRYSSRTRLTTDRFAQLHRLAAAAERLRDKLPEALRDDPDLRLLRGAAPCRAVRLMHLIHRKQRAEGASKDYEFSRRSMQEHWDEGEADALASLDHPEWRDHRMGEEGLFVFDHRNPAKTEGQPHPAARPRHLRSVPS